MAGPGTQAGRTHLQGSKGILSVARDQRRCTHPFGSICDWRSPSAVAAVVRLLSAPSRGMKEWSHPRMGSAARAAEGEESIRDMALCQQ